MNEKPPKNWMSEWEQEQDKKQTEFASREMTKTNQDSTSKTELDHVESLIKEDMDSVYYEISHSNFDAAKVLLEECLEKYKNVPTAFLQEFDNIQSLIEMRDKDLREFENGDPEQD